MRGSKGWKIILIGIVRVFRNRFSINFCWNCFQNLNGFKKILPPHSPQILIQISALLSLLYTIFGPTCTVQFVRKMLLYFFFHSNALNIKMWYNHKSLLVELSMENWCTFHFMILYAAWWELCQSTSMCLCGLIRCLHFTTFTWKIQNTHGLAWLQTCRHF